MLLLIYPCTCASTVTVASDFACRRERGAHAGARLFLPLPAADAEEVLPAAAGVARAADHRHVPPGHDVRRECGELRAAGRRPHPAAARLLPALLLRPARLAHGAGLHKQLACLLVMLFTWSCRSRARVGQMLVLIRTFA